MRKVITIDLDGEAVLVEEDGYQALRTFLEGAQRAWAGDADHAGKLAALERAIRERCRLALGTFRNVVSGADISRILAEIGPVTGAGTASQSCTAADTADSGAAGRQDSGCNVPPAPARAAPGYAARLTGGVLVPVFTVLSAAWFATLAAVLLVLWWSTNYVHFAHWPPQPWSGITHLPQWIAAIIALVVYVLIALPIGAGRRAALYYANGGRAHGWANFWSGLLWMALVALVLLGAWLGLPLLQQALHALFGWPGIRGTGGTWV